jgi:hypothetical protein
MATRLSLQAWPGWTGRIEDNAHDRINLIYFHFTDCYVVNARCCNIPGHQCIYLCSSFIRGEASIGQNGGEPSMMMCWIEADRGDRGRGVSVLVVSDGFK